MKKIFVFLFLICLSVTQVQAYSVKIYNESGNLIGTAKKSGNDYEIYDLNGNKVIDYDTFYTSTGDEDRKKLKEGINYVTIESGQIPGNVFSYMSRPLRTRVIQAGYNPYKNLSNKVKVYDKTGKNVGYAVKDGNDGFIIYDLNSNVLQTDETLYYPPGTPLSYYTNKYSYRTEYRYLVPVKH